MDKYKIILKGQDTEYIYTIEVKDNVDIWNFIAREKRKVISIEIIN